MSFSKKLSLLFAGLFICLAYATAATAANRYWIGANNDWDTAADNWSTSPTPPHTIFDEPDADDVAIFNSSHSVNLANAFEQILGLTMSGGIFLSLNDNGMTVNGLIQLSDASTDLVVGGSNAILTADAITINSGAELTVSGGQMGVYGQSGVGLLDVNAGGELSGNGLILLADSVSAGVELLELDGTLTAHSTAAGDFLSLAFATLTISVSDSDGVIDLDGNSGVSTINVLRNDTLAINGGVLDSDYSGTINLSAGATFSRNVAWSLNGTLNANTSGSTAATIAGAAFTQTGGSINIDAGESLRLSSVFNGTDGVIVNNGLIIVDNTATVLNSVQFQTGTSGSLEVNGSLNVHSGAGWDWDGNGGSDNVITIGAVGMLDAALTVDDVWDGLMNINGGTLFVGALDGAWGQGGGTINLAADAWVFSGTAFSKTGGALHVLPGADAHFQVAGTWTGGTQDIDGQLRLDGVTTFNGALFTGDGTLATERASVVTADTTIDVQTFDWDGVTTTNEGYTINTGVTFTINSPNFDADNAMDDPITLAGTGAQLIVNGPVQWKMRDTFTVNAGIGSVIGGTSRMLLEQFISTPAILNVNGNTTISAPITFGIFSTTNVSDPFSLTVTSENTIYQGGTITGGGAFLPGLTNTVTQSNSTISTDTFHFDRGTWTINPGATLTVNVTDYDDQSTDSFDNTITINGGTVNIVTGDPEFIIGTGTVNLNHTSGTSAVWTGQPLVVGDDAGVLGAQLNVGGAGISRINSIVTFNSDADTNIAAGATLVLGSTVSFMSVNGANNAEFTGPGSLVTNSSVNFLEATTLDMAGGTVDFDGENSDASVNLIAVYAPLVVNAAIFDSFGAAKAGADNLLVDNEAAAGSLTVNTEWTLDAPGILQLLNDATNSTLLAGSDLNLEGRLFLRGAVQSDARLDIVGEIQMLIAGGTLRLNGGDNLDDPNTLAGGSILAGINLAANPGRALHGFGQIFGDIDFDGAANLLADNGSLELRKDILDVGTLGTASGTGILYVEDPWNTNVTDLVQLSGGELRGGTVTNDGAAGINGHGLIASRIVNNTRIDAEGGPLLIETAANDNDWDGSTGMGSLNAVSGNLEIRDDATFLFAGTVSAAAGREVLSGDFELEFEPGSTLTLADGARYRSTNDTDIGGALVVTGGTASLEIDGTTVLENGSTTALTGDLRLENPVTMVQAGATFAGGGSLINPPDRMLQLLDGANVAVLIDNQGTLELGASPGQALGLDFQQNASGSLEIEIAGTGLNDFDRLSLTGQALLAGTLNVSLLDGFSPVLGNTFNFLSATGGISGTFDVTNLPTLAAGLVWLVNYDNPTFAQLVVVESIPGDFNQDGTVDAADYIMWRKTDGTQAGYDTWRAHFGETVGGGAGAGGSDNLAVPEPTSLAWLLLAAAIGVHRLPLRRAL